MEKKLSQSSRLYELLSDGQPHRTDEICAKVYGDEHLGLARVGARIWDLKKGKNLVIEGWKDKDNHALYWYQMKIEAQVILEEKKVWSPQHFINLAMAKQTMLF